MALASISVRGFRNLEPTIVGFAEGSNYLFGPNGAGKTNLLEAIHYLATGRSFRRCPDADLLGFGRDVLIVSGTDESGDTAEIRFDGREKRLLRNNIPVEKLSEYFGWLPVVVLLLEDIELVRGAPSIRRGYLDMAMAKADGGDKSKGKGQKPKAKSEGEEQEEERAKAEARSQKLEARSEEEERAKAEARSQKLDGRSEEREEADKSEAKSQKAKGKSEGQEEEGERAKAEARGQKLEARSEEEERAKAEARSQRLEARSEEEERAKSEARSQMLEVRSEGEEQGKSEGERRRAKGEGRGEEQSYITLMGEYRRAVGQYNRLLERSAVGGGRSADEIAAWEEEVVRTGVPVYEARLAKVGGLLENATKHYERLAGHEAVFSYRSSIAPAGTRSEFPGRNSVMSPTDLAEAFRQRLAATHERARYIGHALVGPHRDDLRIARGERELRKFGSVGEQRLAGIALRLAEADMILSAGRQRPVFLLDEVASELDEERSRMVLEMVAERGQMVYAAARRIQDSRIQGFQDSSAGDSCRDRSASLESSIPGPLDPFRRKEFRVEAGTVSEVS